MVPIIHGEIFDGEVDLAGLVPRKTDTAKVTPKQPAGQLGMRIEEVRESCGLLHVEMAQALTDELRVPISPQVVARWVAGSSPRKLPIETVFAALDRIEQRLQTESGATWVAKEEVGRQITAWLKTMSVGELSKRIGESPQLVSKWSQGQHAVLWRRWKRVLEVMGP